MILYRPTRRARLTPIIEYRLAPNRGGFALFAATNLAAGETVLEEPVVEIPDKDWKVISTTVLHEYCFETEDAAYFPLGYADLLSHAKPGNLFWRIWAEKRLIIFIALRDISTGEELTFDYGWKSYPWERQS